MSEPQTKPIVCQIVDAFEIELRKIKIANGYAIDMEVERLALEDNEIKPDSALVYPLDPIRLKQPGEAGNEQTPFIRWEQPIAVEVTIRESKKSTQPLDEQLMIRRSAVEQCIGRVDGTWGGIATRTTIEEPRIYYEFAPPVVLCMFNVYYHTLRDDPALRNLYE
jgi:hypothetical protein